MGNIKNILVEYPKNKNIKFLFTSYPAEELTGRDRVVKENLRLPFEGPKEAFLVIETDLSDLPDSLQAVLRDTIQPNESDAIVFRAFAGSAERSLVSEMNIDIYNLVYSEFNWDKKVKNNSLN